MKLIFSLAFLITQISFGNTHQIFIKSKEFNGERHFSYFDETGREVYFRGFNVSGSVKLTSMGFKPFKNSSDAKTAFRDMVGKTGANVVRFTISWEGTNPTIDTIDEKYLEEITSFIQEAIAQNIYVILDYHQDLFSRYLFNSKSKTTGNGAPKYIIEGLNLNPSNCIFCFQWAMNYALNKGVKSAFTGFWENSKLNTPKGSRFIQDEFLWQLEKTLTYLKNHLSDHEFSYILGLDPFNEPVSGNRKGKSLVDWNRDNLYPFYFKVQKTMNLSGWDNKILFAEPSMDLFSKNPFYPEFVKNPPKGWSLNAHFYDVHQTKVTQNGAYLSKLEKIKEDAKSASIPPFLSEFGYYNKNERVKNRARKINGVYQALEISKEKDSNFAKFFAPTISSTQWSWDIYHNNHHEILNFSGKVNTEADAWNGEDYSMVTDNGQNYTVPDRFLIERIFPRKCQGHILHFYYNAIPYDGRSEYLQWGSLKLADSLYLQKSRFFFMVFEGINSKSPTEIFIPPHFNSLYVVTENEIKTHKGNTFYHFAQPNKSGLHFILLLSGDFSQEFLLSLQNDLKKIVLEEKRSPIFLPGKVRPF